MLQPDQFSATIPGVRTVSTVKTAAVNIGRPHEEKVFIWQRAILDPKEALDQQKNLIRRGYLIVLELDDDPRRWQAKYEETAYFTFRSCHCIQTSTEIRTSSLRCVSTPEQPVAYEDVRW